MKATCLRKQQELDPDPKAIQQINFTANLDRDENKKSIPLLKKQKKPILDFSQKTAKEFWTYFNLVKYHYKTTEYNTLNVKLYNSHLNKLQSWTKNGTGVIFIECCWWIKW